MSSPNQLLRLRDQFKVTIIKNCDALIVTPLKLQIIKEGHQTFERKHHNNISAKSEIYFIFVRMM